jgi:cell division initiation protein
MLMKTDEPTQSQAIDVRRLPTPERHLAVTPIDMRQARFASAMRGFERSEVTAFLEEAATDFEAALRENERLRSDIVRLEASLEQYRELENSLKSTLISAQRISDDMRANAEKEAARIVREAEGQAALMKEKAQARLEEMDRDIEALRQRRRDAEVSIEATISTLQNSLEFVRNQDRRERETKPVVALVPRPQAVATA